ncbi:MAG TPA: TrkA family potassium uptake protein [Bacillota bacterium]|nr:TrkA family potassium uptake protein [Bacillota bacterium]
MKQRFVVIGLGRFGGSVALQLARWGYEVLGVDRDEVRVKAVMQHLTRAVEADAANPRAFKSLQLAEYDTAIVATGLNLEASVVVTTRLKLGGCPRVVARAADDLQATILTRLGADRVVLPEQDMGERVARNLALPNVLDYLSLAPGYRVVEVRAPESLHGRSLKQLDLGSRFGLNVVALRGPIEVEVPPRPDRRIEPGDVLVVVGPVEGLKFFNGR